MTSPNVLIRYGVVVCALWLAACGNDDGPNGGSPTIASLQIAGQLGLEVGGSSRLTVQATLSDSSTRDVSDEVTWAVSSPTLALIDQSGNVTALGAGSTDVTATHRDSGVSATATITVTNGAVSLQSLHLSVSDLTLGVSFVRRLRATAVFSSGLHLDVTEGVSWSSSSTAVATVSDAPGQKGYVTAVSAGATVVQAAHAPSSTAASASVTVANQNAAALVSLATNVTSVSTRVSALTDLKVNATFADNTVRDVTGQVVWLTSDPKVVGVDPVHPGRIIGLAPGTARVTASVGNVSSPSVPVTVAATVFDDLVVIADDSIIYEEDLVQLRAEAHVGAEVVDVTSFVNWRTSAPAVAQIDNLLGAKGELSALTAGALTATAALPDGSRTATLDLTVLRLILEDIAIDESVILLAPGQTKALNVSGTFNSGETKPIAARLNWVTTNAAIAVVTRGVLSAPVDAPSWSGITRGDAVVTGTYPGSTLDISATVRKGEYSVISAGATPTHTLQMSDSDPLTVTLQRDVVTVGTPYYRLTTNAPGVELLNLTFAGNAVQTYDATTPAASVDYQTTTYEIGVSSALASTVVSAPISGTVTVRALGGMLEPAVIDVNATACPVDSGACSETAANVELRATTAAVRLPDLGSREAPYLLTRGFGSFQAPADGGAYFILPIPAEGIGKLWEVGAFAEAPTIEVFADETLATRLTLSDTGISQALGQTLRFTPTGPRAVVHVTFPTTREFVLTTDYASDLPQELDLGADQRLAQVGGLPNGNAPYYAPTTSAGDYSQYIGVILDTGLSYTVTLTNPSATPLSWAVSTVVIRDFSVEAGYTLETIASECEGTVTGNVTCTFAVENVPTLEDGQNAGVLVTVRGNELPDQFGAIYNLGFVQAN